MQLSSLVIAGYSIAINCDNRIVASYLDRELGPFFGGDGSDMELVLRVSFSDDAVLPATADGDIEVTLPNGTGVILSQEARERRLELTAVVGTGSGTADDDDYACSFLTNYIFSLVMQQLQAEGRAHLFLVHSCGALRDGRAYLFAGSSGRGKSTTAHSLAGEGFKLLGDDMVLVSHDVGGWKAHGSPMGGDIPRTALVNDSVPLGAVFFIEQGPRTRWREMSPAQATALLISLIVPSYPLTKTAPKELSDYNREAIEILIDEAFLLTRDIPCFELELKLGDNPWTDIFNTIKEGGLARDEWDQT